MPVTMVDAPPEPYFPDPPSPANVHEHNLELPSWSVRFISNDETPMEAETVVLLLHGSGGTAESWLAVAQHLHQGTAWVSCDLPGFGRSTAPDEGPTPDASVRCLAELAEAIAAERLIVVGHSLGGLAALHWSSDPSYSKLVAGFGVFSGTLLSAIQFLDDPVHGILRDPGLISTALAQVAIVGIPWPAAVRELLVDNRYSRALLLHRFVRDTNSIPLSILDDLSQATASSGSLKVLKNVRGYDPVTRFRACHNVGFAVAGEGDGLVTLKDLQRFAALQPNASVESVAGASHWIVHEYPIYAASLIDELLYAEIAN